MNFWDELEKVETEAEEHTSVLSNIGYYLTAVVIAVGLWFVVLAIIA